VGQWDELSPNSPLKGTIALMRIEQYLANRRYWDAASWLRALAAHAVFSVIFSLTHVVLMYWARVFAFTASNEST
jgi:hypothetical protein